MARATSRAENLARAWFSGWRRAIKPARAHLISATIGAAGSAAETPARAVVSEGRGQGEGGASRRKSATSDFPKRPCKCSSKGRSRKEKM
jgi:hypothetical protein